MFNEGFKKGGRYKVNYFYEYINQRHRNLKPGVSCFFAETKLKSI